MPVGDLKLSSDLSSQLSYSNVPVPHLKVRLFLVQEVGIETIIRNKLGTGIYMYFRRQVKHNCFSY